MATGGRRHSDTILRQRLYLWYDTATKSIIWIITVFSISSSQCHHSGYFLICIIAIFIIVIISLGIVWLQHRLLILYHLIKWCINHVLLHLNLWCNLFDLIIFQGVLLFTRTLYFLPTSFNPLILNFMADFKELCPLQSATAIIPLK